MLRNWQERAVEWGCPCLDIPILLLPNPDHRAQAELVEAGTRKPTLRQAQRERMDADGGSGTCRYKLRNWPRGVLKPKTRQ